MKNNKIWQFLEGGIVFPLVVLLLIATSLGACSDNDEIKRPTGVYVFEDDKKDSVVVIIKDDTVIVKEDTIKTDTTKKDFLLPNIDLSHWKVTIPIGKPTEVSPPEILKYATNDVLKPFMYNDSTDGSIVFYAYPESSTANSSYSRSELREQMVPGSNSTNWTFKQGAKMRGTLAVPKTELNEAGKYYDMIIMQIHGRLTDAQRDLIGQSDNNAPPILKIYWRQGRVQVKTKVIKNLNYTYQESLVTDNWGDDSGRYFKQRVDHDKFMLEVNVSEGKMTVTMNDSETFTYNDIHMQKWGVFENYFKAGNYFQSHDAGSYSRVKYYELAVSHD
jgi:hypothetical protein